MRKMKNSGIEWIGEIPEDWETFRLGGLASMIVPMRDKPTSFDGDIPWIRIEDFDGMYISGSKSSQNVSLELIDQMNMKIYPVGTVLCSCSCNLGHCAITTVPMCSNQTFIGIVPSQKLHNKFLYYVLSSSEKVLNSLSQGTIQSYLSQQDFSKFKIAYCDVERQKGIANYLDKKCAEIDAIIAAKEKTNELLKERRQSIIYEAVTKGLDPTVPMKDSGIEWVVEIPESWDVWRLKHLLREEKGSIKAGPFGSSITANDMQGHDVKVFTQRTVLDNDFVSGEEYISSDKYEELKGFSVQSGDILITTRGTIGKTAIVPENTFGILHPCLIKMSIDSEKMNKSLLCRVFNETNIFQEQLRLASNATTIDVIYTQNLMNMFVPLAPLKEQEAINAYLDDKCSHLDKLISSNESTIEKLKEYRQSVIYEAVTGKVEI